MKTRTKFLSLIFGTTVATSAIIAPTIILSSCSNGDDSGSGNNNQNGNGSGNNNQNGTGNNNSSSNIDFTISYVDPLPTKNIAANNFANCEAKIIQYFKNNATLERLNSDLNQDHWCSPPNNQSRQELFNKAEPGSIPNTINFHQKLVNSNPQAKNEFYYTWYNVSVKPAICWDTHYNKFYNVVWNIPIQNLSYYNHWIISYNQNDSSKGLKDYGFFKKEDLINDVKMKYKQNPSAFDPQNDKYILQKTSMINTPEDYLFPNFEQAWQLWIIKDYDKKIKIFKENIYKKFPCLSMNVSLENIIDVDANFEKKPPAFNEPVFPNN